MPFYFQVHIMLLARYYFSSHSSIPSGSGVLSFLFYFCGCVAVTASVATSQTLTYTFTLGISQQLQQPRPLPRPQTNYSSIFSVLHTLSLSHHHHLYLTKRTTSPRRTTSAMRPVIVKILHWNIQYLLPTPYKYQ